MRRSTAKIGGLLHSVIHACINSGILNLLDVFIGGKSKHAVTEIHQLSILFSYEWDVELDR